MIRKLMMIALVLALGSLSFGVDTAEAKRLGGGSSFGKQRSTPDAQPAMAQRSTPATAANNQRGSARSGIMGMLGGLALGGLLGALLFGGGFEGINFLDIVILGLMVLGVVWFLRKRAAAVQQQDYAYAGGQPATARADHAETPDAPRHDFSRATARPDIDEAHFLQASKTIFMRMQQAWDRQDMDDIQRFCTPEVAEKIRQDLPTDGSRNDTEVGMLNAQLLDAWMEDDQDWVAVHFTALLREKTLLNNGQAAEDHASEINETWTFCHDPSDQDPTWYLAGISQH